MYLLLVLVFVIQNSVCEPQEPKCLSSFDFQEKLLYKLIKIEEEVKAFRKYVDDAKERQKKTEEDQINKLETALELFRNSTDQQMVGVSESSEKMLQEMNESINDFKGTVATLKNGTMIGFTVRGPKDSPTSGQITFSTVVTNEGEGYDKTTGVFVCKVPGIYYFSVNLFLMNDGHTDSTDCYIYRNDTGLAHAFTGLIRTPAQGVYAAGNSVFVRLVTGDRVRLAGSSPASTMMSFSSFSGFLIRAE